MNKKKLFGVLTAASMLMNSGVAVFAEEMVETTPTGTVPGATNSNVALTSENFPDGNFLQSLKNDNPGATTAGDVKVINVPSQAQSLEGLQYLTKATSFTMNGNNNISTLDLSNCTALAGAKEQVVDENGDPVVPTAYTYPITITGNLALTSITFPQDEDVKAILVQGNAALDDLDLSPLSLIQNVDIPSNSLDELDLSGNVYVTELNASSNDLYQLDATPCKQLTTLNVSYNKIYEMKVPTAIPTALQNLNASFNKLPEFDASALKGVVSLDLRNNMLKSVKLPKNNSVAITNLQLQNNHLASLNLKNVNLGNPDNGADLNVSDQYLYANDTDKAINIKEYDPNFNPDKALVNGKNDFDEDGIFTIQGEGTVPGKAEFIDGATKVVLSEDEDGKLVATVYLNDILVTPDNYTLDPSIEDLNGEGMTLNDALKETFTVTGRNNYTGKVEVTPEKGTSSSGGEGTTALDIANFDVTLGEPTPAEEGDSARVRLEVEDEEGTTSVTDFTYTGSAIEPSVVVKNKETDEELVLDTDYTLSYSNNENASGDVTPDTVNGPAGEDETAPYVTITGKGKYTGSIIATFQISPLDAAECGAVLNVTGAAVGSDGTASLTFNTVEIELPDGTKEEITLDGTDNTITSLTAILRVNNTVESNPTTFTVDSTNKKLYTGQATKQDAAVDAITKVKGTLNVKVVPDEGSNPNIEGEIAFGGENGVDIATLGTAQDITVTMPEETDSAPVVLNEASSVKNFYTYNTDSSVNLNQSSNNAMTVKIVKASLMNRLYNPNSGEHFYTKDTHEKDVLVELGWQYEGIGWVAPTTSSIPVYRLYNPNAGDHHYTKDPNEKDTLVRVGWSYEGVGWYSASDSTSGSDNAQQSYINTSIEVFREYNPNAKAAGAHNYTINEIENEVLTSIGWLDEGIAWWARK